MTTESAPPASGDTSARAAAQGLDTSAPPDTDTPPPTGEGGDTDTSTAGEFKIPEQYKDAKWTQEVKSEDDLWKRISELQSLAGKKVIPGGEATEEELNEFYSQLRPESADKYELTIPEGMELTDKEEDAKVREMFHKHGLSQQQAAGLYNDYLEMEKAKAVGKQAEGEKTEEELNKEFDDLADTTIGKDKIDQAIKTAHAYLASFDPVTKDAFSKLPNNMMIAVTKILYDNHVKFAGEDGALPTGGGAATGGGIQEARDELAKLRVSEAARDFTHKDHDATKKRIDELSERIQKHYRQSS